MVTGTQVKKTEMGQAQVAPPGRLIEMPNFHTDFKSMELFDGQNVHLETKLTPMNDPKLSIVWFHNGKPLAASKFTMCFYWKFIPLKVEILLS